MKQRFRTGGLASWSIRRPVAVSMLALTVIILGFFSLENLKIDLLPKLIYPEIRVRIVDSGVPARIMEDQITRQLEEQLAITEGATVVQSTTSEGRSQVSLSFPYGMDIDVALREASTRLDRAKRFLPDTIDPATIYKRDPSQIPILEMVVSSGQRDPVELRSWVDYEFSKWFLNIPGVAAAEVGGGLVREIQIIVDQEKMAAAGFQFSDIIDNLQRENLDVASGTLYMERRQFSTRTQGRFQSVADIANLPLINAATQSIDDAIRLSDIADVRDTHEDERIRIRLNNTPGIKLSIQKQPEANTVAVVDAVLAQLDWFKQQKMLPTDIVIEKVGDQSTYVRHSLRNASMAALSGALLAMFIVYVFLGDIRRTLIISTAIPLAVLVTLSIMQVSGLTLNIMSLGGLALGIGILVDNTIVILENISRHQASGKDPEASAIDAAAEVTSAVTASTTTNLVAVLPFLFIGGLVGLLFSELIITLSAAIVASLIVALTLVPALGSRVKHKATKTDTKFNRLFATLHQAYIGWLKNIIQKPGRLFVLIVPVLALSLFALANSKEVFFPAMDEGQISMNITSDPGTRLEEMDRALVKLENLFLQQPDVDTVFTTSGGSVFGRSSYERSNRGSIYIQLKPMTERGIATKKWVGKMQPEIAKLKLAGMKMFMHVRGVRGVNLGHGDDDISLRIQGTDLAQLAEAGDRVIEKIKHIAGVSNLQHSYEEQSEELVLVIDRERAADLGIHANDIGRALNIALNGMIVTDFLDNDRQFDIRLRLNREFTRSTSDIENIIVAVDGNKSIHLRDVANIKILPTPSTIKRDNQRRIVEVSGSLAENANLVDVMKAINKQLEDLNLPEGYSIYDGGSLDTLREGQKIGYILLGLALFLVFVVMAVQYESLRNPLVIMLSIPFTIIGVSLGVELVLDQQLSMPAKIGIIMLAGIVVNNAIVLVEQIEIQREQGQAILDAIIEAAGLRLRPIMMTTLTTVMGMLPLAIGMGEGSEMLRPMATVIVFGLSVSMLVSLFLVPIIYRLLHKEAVA
ncbi:MAG: efflux RND transporter permease subunit [Gammaproteobacteria bacterium]|nr:efflux RND transporter permease subunit [Gammaproteobacteria bacterium]